MVQLIFFFKDMIILSWLMGIMIGLITYLHEIPAENPEALCFVYTERTDKLFILITSSLVIIPCNLGFIFIYVKIYRAIINSVSLFLSLFFFALKCFVIDGSYHITQRKAQTTWRYCDEKKCDD